MSEPDPYPFEAADDEIRELDLESIDAFGDDRVTVGELVGETESWRYGHVIVDEAQDLTPMQWRMVMRRVRGRSLTIVGDLAQRSGPIVSSWHELLPPELHNARRQDLTVNYRSPREIHALALDVLAELAPDVPRSTAIRAAGHRPELTRVDDLVAAVPGVVDAMLRAVGGQVAVIGEAADLDRIAGLLGPAYGPSRDRVRALTAIEAKGLEFDAVVLVEPAHLFERSDGPARLYIALTRATQRLSIVHQEPLPAVLRRSTTEPGRP